MFWAPTDSLEHSWGKSAAAKAREKEYNHQYYLKNKDKWKTRNWEPGTMPNTGISSLDNFVYQASYNQIHGNRPKGRKKKVTGTASVHKRPEAINTNYWTTNSNGVSTYHVNHSPVGANSSDIHVGLSGRRKHNSKRRKLNNLEQKIKMFALTTLMKAYAYKKKGEQIVNGLLNKILPKKKPQTQTQAWTQQKPNTSGPLLTLNKRG